MKLLRDLSGDDLAKALARIGAAKPGRLGVICGLPPMKQENIMRPFHISGRCCSEPPSNFAGQRPPSRR
jgi:hypothetical protein